MIVFIGINIYKNIFGDNIRHYSQYIFPCQGQISTLKAENTTISFFVLDEKKISELSSEKNIKRIYVQTKNEKNIEATSWEVQEAFEFSEADKYSTKKLSFKIRINNKQIIKKLVICYADKEEVFDIGNLTIYPLDVSDEMASVSISSDPSICIGKEDEMIDSSKYTKALAPSIKSLFFSVNMQANDLHINQIDFGIKGMGIEPKTCKKMPLNTDFGVAFSSDSSNQVYTLEDSMNQLPNQLLNLKVEKSEKIDMGYLVAIRKSFDFEEKPCSLYISPIYSCKDDITNKEFLFGDPLYFIMSPEIMNNKVATKLLKELGK